MGCHFLIQGAFKDAVSNVTAIVPSLDHQRERAVSVKGRKSLLTQKSFKAWKCLDKRVNHSKYFVNGY